MKKYKVTGISMGCHHMIARCNDCPWADDYGAGGHTERERVRKATKNHVAETGHTVNIEQGLFWQYFPDEPNEAQPWPHGATTTAR